MNLLSVSPSPHIHIGRNTRGIMADVIIALVPSIISSVLLFGFYSIAMVSAGILTAIIGESLFNLICKRPQTIGDLSAVVTGIILALSLPTSVPIWQIAVGTLFAIIVVKCLFGGIGKNFANPAATARVFLLFSFSQTVGSASIPINVDTASSSTPLVLLKNGAEHKLPTVFKMLLGVRGGSIGETCVIAILLGFIYLLLRRVITPHAPLGFIVSLAVLSFIFGRNPLYEITSGSAFFAAVFMATDYSSSPINKRGRLIFGLGCGLLTFIIRLFGNYPEGVSFALLFMNILTPYIDKVARKKALGGIYE